MARCPHTNVTIPECSCSKCLEDQVRRAAPALLDQETTARRGVATAPDRTVAPSRRAAEDAPSRGRSAMAAAI